MTLRCAILDDYQNVALTMADWSPLRGKADITVFNEHLGGPDNVIKALQDFEIVCAMRERTGFPRAVIEKLPELKLLMTTGARNASIDVAACNERGIVVCGTPSIGNPTSGIAIGLMLELTRRIGYECARMKAGVPWQTTIGLDLGGLTLALEAYHASLHGKPAPVVDGLTGDQRVFLGWAQAWRGKLRDDAIRRQVVSDPHSPRQYRVNGVVRNIDAWYGAFTVKPEEKLFVDPKERVRIW